MRAWHLTRVHSCSYHHNLLLALELPRPLAVREQQGVFKALFPLSEALRGADCEHFDWPSLERVDDGASVEVDVLVGLRAEGDVVKEAGVVLVGPGEVNGEVVFLVGRKLMREGPFDLVIAVYLSGQRVTMLVRLTLCEIRLHSELLASRTTGTSPS